VPEGDTIFRSATTLRKWLGDQQVTDATTKVPGLQLQRVIGTTVTEVTPKAKHLLIRFSNGLVLHTHMRMTGAWHVYRAGEKWKKPQWQAKLVLTCGDRVAVCFNAPVVELLLPSEERRHRSLNGLGPDVLGLDDEFDYAEVRKRAAVQDPDLEIGVLLLDQQVVSGIGNIYRCEALFADGWNPWTPRSALTSEQLDHLIDAAMTMMKQSSKPGGHRHDPWVYGRTNRPCRRCATPIEKSRIGKQARDVFWCPKCQPSFEAENARNNHATQAQNS
jgi:endonuclease-8